MQLSNRHLISLFAPARHAYALEIVSAALVRSFTASQIRGGSAGESEVSGSAAVLIEPDDSEVSWVGRMLDRGGKVLVLGAVGPAMAELLGIAVRNDHEPDPRWCEVLIEPSRPFDLSPASIRYDRQHPLGNAACLERRALCRYDFTDEWNNLGYGRILCDRGPWAIACIAESKASRCIAVVEGEAGEELSAYAVAGDSPSGAALWINRPVGPVDSAEWRLVEHFFSEYRCEDLVSFPYLREIPLGYRGAVTMRLDCDQAVESALPLFELYRDRSLPFSLAVLTGLDMDSRAIEVLRTVVDHGGSVVSHSVNHFPDWGGSYEAALNEARISREWLESTLNRPIRYAVSPFHQNPVFAVQALADAGYRGFVGGSIHNDPEFLLGRAGRVPFCRRPLISHSQQCMLHGDCHHRAGSSLDVCRESFASSLAAGAIFGYLDHPFSAEYQYGWDTEQERLGAHEEFLDHLLAVEGLWWGSEEQVMDFLVRRDAATLRIDEDNTLRFTCPKGISDKEPAASWKGRVIGPTR